MAFTLKLKPFKPKPEPLMMLVCGQQGDGKTTCMASLLRAPTMLLYVSTLESHSPTYLSNGCSLYPEMESYKGEKIPAADANNLLAVAVDKREEADAELYDWMEKIPIGATLTPDQANAKLVGYLKAASEAGVTSVVVDSLSALMSVFKGTTLWKNMCTNAQGKHDGWGEGKAYLHLIQEMMVPMIALKDKGINCIVTCGAKKELTASNNSGDVEASAFTPELPSFGVIQHVVYFFPDISPIMRSDEYEGYARVFDFEVEVKKASVDAKKVVKKYMQMTPRLLAAGCLPLTTLPADLWRIPEFIEAMKESQ